MTVEIGHNVVRVPGLSAADVASAAVLARYPARGGAAQPSGWVLVRTDPASWHEMVLGAQFAAKPIDAGVVPTTRQYIPTASADVMHRVHATGFPKAGGLESVILGDVSPDVFLDVQNLGLKLTQLKAATPAALSHDLVPFRGGWARKYSSSVIVASSDNDARQFALPVAAWSAYSGDTIAFVSRDRVPPVTAKLLMQRKGLRLEKPTIYLAGPPSVISNAVARSLARFGTVKRLPGADPIDFAVDFARYKDRATGFGWGLTSGPANLSLISLARWTDAVGAFAFAATGPQAPLLLTDRGDALPAAVGRYLASLRGREPNQGFVFGDERGGITSGLVAKLDGLLAPVTR